MNAAGLRQRHPSGGDGPQRPPAPRPGRKPRSAAPRRGACGGARGPPDGLLEGAACGATKARAAPRSSPGPHPPSRAGGSSGTDTPNIATWPSGTVLPAATWRRRDGVGACWRAPRRRRGPGVGDCRGGVLRRWPREGVTWSTGPHEEGLPDTRRPGSSAGRCCASVVAGPLPYPPKGLRPASFPTAAPGSPLRSSSAQGVSRPESTRTRYPWVPRRSHPSRGDNEVGLEGGQRIEGRDRCRRRRCGSRLRGRSQ